MANIKQQKKRVGIAARQRFENLRYKSTAKTLFRSLQDSVNLGDKDAAAGFHRELVRLLDRAAARNVMHRNTVARKKARAARILESEPVAQPAVVRRARKKGPVRKPKAERAAAAVTEAASEERSEAKAAAAGTGKRKAAAAAPDETLPETQAAHVDVEGEAATETGMSKAAAEGDAEVPAEAAGAAGETGEGSEEK